MNTVQVHLKDYAGREFGGDYKPIEMSIIDGQLVITLQYCGRKASKRLSLASITIDAAVLKRILIAKTV